MKKRLFLISTILFILLCISTSTVYGISEINQNPQTGDTVITYLSMCLISFAGIVLLYKIRRFRKN